MKDLRELLQEHDPAKGSSSPSAEELASMRERLVAAAGDSSTPRFRPVRWVAAAAILFVVVMSGWSWMRQGISKLPAEPVVQSEIQLEVQNEEPRRTRQVQFSTPNGTRIIWLLDSEFEV